MCKGSGLPRNRETFCNYSALRAIFAAESRSHKKGAEQSLVQKFLYVILEVILVGNPVLAMVENAGSPIKAFGDDNLFAKGSTVTFFTLCYFAIFRQAESVSGIYAVRATPYLPAIFRAAPVTSAAKAQRLPRATGRRR